MSSDMHDRLDEEIREFQAAQTWVWPIRPDPRLQEIFAHDPSHRMVCPRCGRETRSRYATDAAFPGTVEGLADGRCKNGCRAAQPRKRVRVGQPCVVCRRPMRPKRMRKADAPWTITYHSRGVCSTCAIRR